MGETKETLLDPIFLRKLERLRIQARRAFPGTMRGERRSTRRGASVEFRDFRKYEAGDDFRHVDWSIFARLERLMLRQFVEEEDARIDILIDQSRSMHFGQPTKFDFARRAAAALAFLAVGGLDRVGVAAFDSDERSRLRAMRGRGHLHSVLSFLEKLSNERPKTVSGEPALSEVHHQPSDQAVEPADSQSVTSLSSVIRRYQRSNPRPGILFVISDFLDDGEYRTEMKLLAQRGFDLNLIQVLAPEELQPQIKGDLMLVDSESGASREVTLNERVLEAYRSALASYTTSLESFCRATGIGYTMLTADVSFEEALLKRLVEGRMAE